MLRVRFARERGRLVAFTVQGEVYDGEWWRPVVRYDTAHGRPHRDLLDWDGRVIAKDWMPEGTPLDEAMTQAQREIEEHWVTYRAACLARRPQP